MSNISSVYFFTLFSSLSFLFGLNYLVRPSRLVLTKILAITFIVLGYLFIASYAILKPNILDYPNFFRTISPFFYALPPLNFLFFWYIFHPNEKFYKRFLILFFPLICQLIENLKFYLSSREVKIQEIKWMLSKGDYFAYSPEFMWFDPIWHVYSKFILYLCTFFVMSFFYVRFRRESRYKVILETPIFNRWILGILFFRLFTVGYIFYLFMLTNDGKVSFINADYLLIAEFVFHIVFLVVHPRFLDVQFLSNQLHLQKSRPINLREDKSKKEEDELREVALKIVQCFDSKQVFLNSQLSSELLGSLTGYPHRLIGKAIKLQFNMSFRDYLNSYRIQYIEHKLKDPLYLKKYSIESIAEASGFGSRQSFYSAFKKVKGCTPKEYFNNPKC